MRSLVIEGLLILLFIMGGVGTLLYLYKKELI